MTEWQLHAVFAVGGGSGAVARHFLTRVITHRFPLSTLVVNVAGSLLLGFGVASLAGSDALEVEQYRRLVVGFCGGFTTFSSFAYQTLDLHRSHTLLHAAANIATSVVACVAGYWLGTYLG